MNDLFEKATKVFAWYMRNDTDDDGNDLYIFEGVEADGRVCRGEGPDAETAIMGALFLAGETDPEQHDKPNGPWSIPA